MRRLMISACLVGERVRYDGKVVKFIDERLFRWVAEGVGLPFCPEVAGGLSVPRDPAEISGGGGGEALLSAKASVMTRAGEDVTAPFYRGARLALDFCLTHGVGLALLKEGSPSCGRHRIYDGHFSGTRISGSGLTSALLMRHGIAVFSEDEIDALTERMG